MTIRVNQEWNTEEWVGKERMYDPPDWHGVSPEVIARRGRPWHQDPSDGPWLDRDDALAQIQSRLDQDLISAEEAGYLRRWATDGYFVVEGVIKDSQLLDEYVRDLDGLWTTQEEQPGLQVMSLHIPGRPPGPIDHAEILSWPIEKRLEVRDSQIWRIHYHHPHSRAGMEITRIPEILRLCQLLLDEPPVLINAIGFKYGSGVSLHQDLSAYHIHPANRLIGVWVACEDISPDAGPLSVFPGSHKTPHWPGWHNYPQTNTRTCHLETRDEQARYLDAAVRGREWKPLPINKGDVIFQHPLQIHGADKIRDREATRFSMVNHYSVSGGDKMHEVEGPFNW